MKKIELLAPCGNMDALVAAVAGGCDAVYLGLTSYSARAFAGNFNREELIEAVRHCHVRDVSVYVTMNTMLYETEIEKAKETVQFLYDNDVDALLVQDFGLFHLVKTMFPDFDIHCSTQMHIHNLAGVKYMKEEGAARIVLARETPIEIIAEACKQGVEIEVFAYGAICISYSGQCLMSSATKNRSANRGMCAQSCRLKYKKEDGSWFQEGDYLLSPKDLNAIDNIPALIKAGVSSLKIEGRMKRPEYVYLVTKTFREAIDACYAGKTYTIDPKRQQELLLMFNRGFSKGHLFHADVDHRMSHYRPNHRGIEIGKVTGYEKGSVTVKLSQSLHQHDGLRILHHPQDIGLTAVKIYKNGKLVNQAEAGDTVVLGCPKGERPKIGDPLHKTSDTALIAAIDEQIKTMGRTIPVSIHYAAMPGQPFVVTITDNDGRIATAQSTTVVEEAKSAPLEKERIIRSLKKTGDFPYMVTHVEGEAGNIFMPVSLLNETRRSAMEQLTELRMKRHERKGMCPYHFALEKLETGRKLLIEAHEQHIEQDDTLAVFDESHTCPVVDENLDQPLVYDNCILSSAGNLYGSHNHCIAGMTMNIANSYALAYVLSKDGIDGAIFSSECNKEQILMALEAFKERYCFTPVTYQLIYGRRVLMYIKDGFMKESIHGFKDIHDEKYVVEKKDGVTMIIEDKPCTKDNPYAYGSYMILHKQDTNAKKLIAEAEAELSNRN